MNKPFAVILGGNNLNRGVVEKLSRENFSVVVVDWNKSPAAPGDIHFCLDIKDSDAILKQLDSMGIRPAFAYTSYDVAVPTVNAIHKAFGLCSNPPELLLASIKKDYMRRKWEEANLFNRKSITVTEDEISRVISFLPDDFIIIKPNAAAGSRGITVLSPEDRSEESIGAALRFAASESIDRTVVLEEYVDGQEFTVEMLADQEGRIAVYGISAKYHTVHAGRNRIAVKLHYNSNVYPLAEYERIASFARACFHSLGLRATFGHLELIQKRDGSFTPIEIGARSSGFIASHLVDWVSGRNFLGDYQSVLEGMALEERLIVGDRSSMYFFYDLPPGATSKRQCNIMEFLPASITSAYSDRDRLLSGQSFPPISGDVERYGFEILLGSQHDLTIENVERAERIFLEKFFGTTEDRNQAVAI
jgi:predicted ATP-grasp superfamily ATP-dependent carboligase